MRIIKSIFIFCLLLASFSVFGQENHSSLESFNLERQSLNQKGMLILGTWSIGNMIWSGFNLNNSDGLKRSYHQMNLGWNAVNLAIAGFGYYQSIQLQNFSLIESLEAQESIKRILAVNAGLDLAYMAGGFYLRERAKNRSEEFDRWEGFGRAVIINGAFLFTFDLIMYWVHAHHGNEALLPILETIQLNGNGIGLKLQL